MKSIFLSKTFWVNVVGLVSAYAGYLPQEYAALVLPAANIILRYMTTQPVSLTGK